jgi:NAD(P)H dehydrogenase (quinone)
MRVAITASKGSLGTAILSQLVNSIGKENIIALARTPDKIKIPGLKVMEGDYNNKAHFEEAFQGVDTILIISGMDHPDKRILQHQNIINASVSTGVKKIVYTSIIGKHGDSTFDPIIKSNRQTEQDIKNSGLEYIIGRNGLYIEPDMEYLENYIKDQKILNCAGNGLCSYTTRSELAFAYTKMILTNKKNGNTYNLTGEAITQVQLTVFFNDILGTDLKFEDIEPGKYLDIQKEINGDFLGSIITGIYTKIRNGEFNVRSDFSEIAEREHISWFDYFNDYKKTHQL